MRNRSIYPTKDSLEEAVSHIEAHLPVCSFNEFYALMMVYENTRNRIQKPAPGNTQERPA